MGTNQTEISGYKQSETGLNVGLRTTKNREYLWPKYIYHEELLILENTQKEQLRSQHWVLMWKGSSASAKQRLMSKQSKQW